MLVCSNCSNPIDAKTKFCLYCDAPVESTYTAIKDSSGAVLAGSKQVSALLNRYKDAYLVAKATVGIGTTIKAIGFILGILIVLGGMFLGSNMRGDVGFTAMVLAVLIGGFVLLQFYILGVLVSAQGQTLKASLDSAVNSSPFLTNEHRAKAMSLPEP